MQIYTHLSNDDLSTVTVRLSKAELASLRLFMKTKPEFQNIGFPQGVRLFYRSKGWYRLDVMNAHNTVVKLKHAVAIMKRWHREYSAAVAAEIRLLLIQAKPELKVAAFIDNGTLGGQYHVQDTRTNVITPLERVRPAAPERLQQLAQRFGR